MNSYPLSAGTFVPLITLGSSHLIIVELYVTKLAVTLIAGVTIHKFDNLRLMTNYLHNYLYGILMAH